ncbi:MAG: NAD(P)H-dependent oxidoreductase subunit E [Chloroflexi bacterium]|nr:NAD(P)H-dependent oxidoreductase subunit E [Chloroflexota bacterium]
MNREVRNALRTTLRQKFPRSRGQLLPALHFLQHEYGHLPDWAMEVVGWHLGIPSSEVYGAATSYTELRITPPAEHIVRLCTGLSCWVNGGNNLIEQAHAEFGADGRADSVTLEETPCAFMCGVAPVVEVDGAWRGRVTPEALTSIVHEVSR